LEKHAVAHGETAHADYHLFDLGLQKYDAAAVS